MTKSEDSVKVKSKLHTTILQTIILKTLITNIRKKWSNYIEDKTQIYKENRLHESDEYNESIQLNEVKRALCLLRNSKRENQVPNKIFFF